LKEFPAKPWSRLLQQQECRPECDSQHATLFSLKSGTVSYRASLTKPSRNGVVDWEHVFVKKVVILSTNFRPNCESNVCYEWHSYWKH